MTPICQWRGDNDRVRSVGSEIVEKTLDLSVGLPSGPVPAIGTEVIDMETPVVPKIARDGDPQVVVPQRVTPANAPQRLAGWSHPAGAPS